MSPTLQADSLPAEPQGKHKILEWVVCPFSNGSSRLRNWTGVSCIAGIFFTNWAVREVLTELVSTVEGLEPRKAQIQRASLHNVTRKVFSDKVMMNLWCSCGEKRGETEFRENKQVKKKKNRLQHSGSAGLGLGNFIMLFSFRLLTDKHRYLTVIYSKSSFSAILGRTCTLESENQCLESWLRTFYLGDTIWA